MSKGRQVRTFDYVNQPYDKVRKLLESSAGPVFAQATKGAAARAEAVASQLKVNIAGMEVGKEIAITLKQIEEVKGAAKIAPKTIVRFEWQAAKSPRLFPLMNAELSVYPLTSKETQLDLSGSYEVPLGVLGKGVDAVVGNRIAEASVHRFLTEVADYLRKTLT